jgi:pre-mRNA-splicing helicase BRR2
MISSQLERPIRIVGLALSIADYREIAEWIGAQPQNIFNFSPVARANSMQIIIQGFD